MKQTESVLKKAGLSFSHQELIDTLKEVELFVIKDKRGKEGKAYIVFISQGQYAKISCKGFPVKRNNAEKAFFGLFFWKGHMVL